MKQDYQRGSNVSRRQFCGLAAESSFGLIVSMSYIGAITAVAETEFVIINGWVLTRTDFVDAGVDS